MILTLIGRTRLIVADAFATDQQQSNWSESMMNQHNGPMTGWMGGGMWIWAAIGTLLVVLLVLAITKISRK